MPHAYIENVTFSDGTTHHFNTNDIVLFVGPNNSGKSEALRGLRDRLQNERHPNVVIRSAKPARHGTLAELRQWLREKMQVTGEGDEENYTCRNQSIAARQLENFWTTQPAMGQLMHFFARTWALKNACPCVTHRKASLRPPGIPYTQFSF